MLQADPAASLDDLRALCQAAQDAALAYEVRTSEQLGAEETGLLQHPADEPAPAWLGVLVAAYKAKQSEVVMRVGAKSAAAAMAEAAPAVVGGAPPRAPAAKVDPSELIEFFNLQSGGAGLGERERPPEAAVLLGYEAAKKSLPSLPPLQEMLKAVGALEGAPTLAELPRHGVVTAFSDVVLAVTVGAGQQAGKHYPGMKVDPAADASVCVVDSAGAQVCVGAKLVAARDMIRRFSDGAQTRGVSGASAALLAERVWKHLHPAWSTAGGSLTTAMTSAMVHGDFDAPSVASKPRAASRAL